MEKAEKIKKLEKAYSKVFDIWGLIPERNTWDKPLIQNNKDLS
jgi:hypothetical protein